MRTPGQRQHNFVLEGLINQAAGAGADPIQFRISHTTDQQLIDMLSATAQAAGSPWPAPHSTARRTGTAPVTRRGVCSSIGKDTGDKIHYRRRLQQDHQSLPTRQVHERLSWASVKR